MEAEGWLLQNSFSSETEGFLQTDQQYKAEGDVSASPLLPLSLTYFTSQIMFTPRILGVSASPGIKILISAKLSPIFNRHSVTLSVRIR